MDITKLDNLPNHIEMLNYESNNLVELNNLPPKLSELNYSNNDGLKKIKSVA